MIETEQKLTDKSSLYDIVMKDISFKDIEKEYEEFVYIVSHDLSAPLRHVKEFTRLLLSSIDKDLSPEQASYANFIDLSLRRLDVMQKALLRMSRINTRQAEFSLINMSDFVANRIENLDLSKCATNSSITVDPLPSIYADRKMIAVLIDSLIDNACRYGCVDGEQKVHISCKETDTDTVFEISDNGIGIDSQFYDVVFTMFRRLHNQDEYGGGVGAGLAISSKIIEHHKGHIFIQSELDQGTSVYFSIPKFNLTKTI